MNRRALALGAALVAVVLVLAWLGDPLYTPHAPLGIISFELAGTGARGHAIAAEWRTLGVADEAAAQLVVDLAFLLLYGLVLRDLCRWVATRRWPRLGAALATGAVVAAGLDLTENLALGGVLAGVGEPVLAPIAAVAAGAKFALAGVAVLYAAVGGLMALGDRRGIRSGA